MVFTLQMLVVHDAGEERGDENADVKFGHALRSSLFTTKGGSTVLVPPR